MRNDRHDHPSLGELLRDARVQAGLSIRQLAPKVGVHHSLLARLENGETERPSPELLQHLADELGLDVNELLACVGVTPSLPEPRMYFRRKLGVSADEAEVLARLIEDHQAKQIEQKRKPSK